MESGVATPPIKILNFAASRPVTAHPQTIIEPKLIENVLPDFVAVPDTAANGVVTRPGSVPVALVVSEAIILHPVDATTAINDRNMNNEKRTFLIIFHPLSFIIPSFDKHQFTLPFKLLSRRAL
ncbi:MAG: hypothetical protein AABZ57_03130 [Candidatus Margulisiibacteriota bacterium]